MQLIEGKWIIVWLIEYIFFANWV